MRRSPTCGEVRLLDSQGAAAGNRYRTVYAPTVYGATIHERTVTMRRRSPLAPRLPRPAHPFVWRLPFHLTRPAIIALTARGFIEADELRRDGQIAELVRLEDAARVTVAPGSGGTVLVLPDRPWSAIDAWEKRRAA